MRNEKVITPEFRRLSSGVAGLDEVLCGGFIPGRAYLVRGGPGTGKTILGLHFLSAGAADGERALFITMDEPEAHIRRNAKALGFDLTGVTFLDLSPTSEFFAKMETYDIFSPAEVEREPITQKIIQQVEKLKPQRVFLEAMTQFRYLTADAFQYHKQALSFLRFLLDQGATVLLSSEGSQSAPDDDLQFVSDGILHLNGTPDNRNFTVVKFRGSDFHSGAQSMRLGNHGMAVFPRLLPERHHRAFAHELISSGVPELDKILHGGLERGTITIISGPSGVGKTTLGLQFMNEAAQRGERSVVYSFEEDRSVLVQRSEAIAIPVRAMEERGALSIVQVEPLLYTPEEFAKLVRQEVEKKKARIVMLDSISGYRLCMRGENLESHLYALGKYLKNMGVTALFINEAEAITGEFRGTELGISYMADNILFLRYWEMDGALHKAIGVLKKRMSSFEPSLRELQITPAGLRVGQPLTRLRGILSGAPEWADLSKGHQYTQTKERPFHDSRRRSQPHQPGPARRVSGPARLRHAAAR